MLSYRRLLLSAFLSSSLLTSCGKEEHAPGNENEVDVHVILGQSNSYGRAYSYQLPADLQKPLEACYIYNPSNGRFEQIHAGVNTLSDKGQFGPVVKAAQLLREYKQDTVYFVLHGVGNSQLHNSGSKEVPDWHPDSQELLPESKETIEKARQALVAAGKEPVFRSIAWWQGEADALEAVKANTYQENETALFASLDEVAYLNNTKRVVYKIFDDLAHLQQASAVNEAKARRAAADKRTIALIGTNHYQRNPQDRLHADAAGMIQAGTDLFKAIKDIK
jgi:hypothetical protein